MWLNSYVWPARSISFPSIEGRRLLAQFYKWPYSLYTCSAEAVFGLALTRWDSASLCRFSLPLFRLNRRDCHNLGYIGARKDCFSHTISASFSSQVTNSSPCIFLLPPGNEAWGRSRLARCEGVRIDHRRDLSPSTRSPVALALRVEGIGLSIAARVAASHSQRRENKPKPESGLSLTVVQ